MKKLILLLAILTPSLSWGQFNVSVNGGYLASIPMNKDNIGKGDFSTYFSVSALYVRNRFIYGINADIYSVGVKSDIVSQKGGGAVTEHDKVIYRGISPNVSFGYQITNNLSLSANVGVVLSNNFKTTYTFSGSFGNLKDSYSSINVKKDNTDIYYSLGIDMSYSIGIYKNISIIPEMSPRFILTNKNNGDYSRILSNSSYLIIPVSIGVKYSF